MRRLLLAAALFVPVVLLLDGDGLTRQLALGTATALFLWLVVRHTGVDGREVALAVGIASLGECVLSVGWGLYGYRHALIPLYVPPGHGVFYALAAATARAPWLRERAKQITMTIVAAGWVVAVTTLILFGDTWGLLWWIGALLLLWRARDPLLLSSCFVYTMALEWLGTGLGNWRWAAVVPGVGLRAANPPSGVGILYIVLDLLVVGAAARHRVERRLSSPRTRSRLMFSAGGSCANS